MSFVNSLFLIDVSHIDISDDMTIYVENPKDYTYIQNIRTNK